jgi:hypothetical protein
VGYRLPLAAAVAAALVAVASGCGNSEAPPSARPVAASGVPLPPNVAALMSSTMPTDGLRIAAVAPAGREDRSLAMVVAGESVLGCTVVTYVTAPRSLRYGGMGFSGGGCPGPHAEPLGVGGTEANGMVIVEGTVAVEADVLELRYENRERERVALDGPVLAEFGRRVVLFETGNRRPVRYELWAGDELLDSLEIRSW